MPGVRSIKKLHFGDRVMAAAELANCRHESRSALLVYTVSVQANAVAPANAPCSSLCHVHHCALTNQQQQA
jgi:hypothetical protein